jgi:hypothetical protein
MNATESDSAPARGPIRRKDRATFVRHLATDVSLAAASDVPVLISGPPNRTLRFALLIVARASLRGRSGLRICDVTRGDDVFNAIEGPDRADATETVLIREVQTLSEANQAVLADLLADRRGQVGTARRRVIAASAISLFQRVKQGTFDARLFYLLNAIHLDVRPARAYQPADRAGLLWLPSSNELSSERFTRITTLSRESSLLGSIIDILAATSRRR